MTTSKNAPQIPAKRTAARNRAAVRDAAPPQRVDGRLILLSEMADFLNDSLPNNMPIASTTPYDWWKRHKQGRLSFPMPKPVRMVGIGPMFRAADVLKWYLSYQGMR